MTVGFWFPSVALYTECLLHLKVNIIQSCHKKSRIKIQVFREITSGRFVNSDRRCGVACCLHRQVLSSPISWSYVDREDGSIRLLRNASNFAYRHSVMFKKVRNFVNNAVRSRNLANLGWLCDSYCDEMKHLFCRFWNSSAVITVILVEGGGSKLLRNVDAYIPKCTASYPIYASSKNGERLPFWLSFCT
jgi:hypothetical protein